MFISPVGEERKNKREGRRETIRVVFELELQVNSSARQVMCAHTTSNTKTYKQNVWRLFKASGGDEVDLEPRSHCVRVT